MYLSKPAGRKQCRYYFTDRSDRQNTARDFSSATCACRAWSSFCSTLEISHEQWLAHAASRSVNNTNNPTPNETETTR
jgi:hypothetical protein